MEAIDPDEKDLKAQLSESAPMSFTAPTHTSRTRSMPARDASVTNGNII